VASSLKNLKLTYLDSLVLHSPLKRDEDTLTVWRAMETQVDEGRVRALGISNNYDAARLRWLYGEARIKPAVAQNRFHKETSYDVEIRQFCREHQIEYQVMRKSVTAFHCRTVAVVLDVDSQSALVDRRDGGARRQRARRDARAGVLPHAAGARDHAAQWHDVGAAHARRRARCKVAVVAHRDGGDLLFDWLIEYAHV
jgi:hypothetical protein